ncbi:MAG: glycine cleavage system protein GcvH [Phycisphaeraceae bacterium]|nr:glycine cleavage system protein GcvH [Phycisphaeraceae bacterium]
MASPSDRVYSKTHEWHRLQDGVVTVGLTRHAVDNLTDITYVQMKPIGTSVGPGDVIGEVESVKTTGDVYAACAGSIIEVNPSLDDAPGLVNEDPYERGWLVRIRMTDDSGLGQCVDAQTYDRESSAS